MIGLRALIAMLGGSAEGESVVIIPANPESSGHSTTARG
jgi:hypothetical protein